MKKYLLLLLIFSTINGQSVDASLTIYKDGFGLIKQPVAWEVKAGQNTIQYGNLTEGLYADSPFLDLNNGEVHTQRLNNNIFSSNTVFKNNLGRKIKLKIKGDKEISGTLLEYNSSQVTILNKSRIETYFKNNLEYISVAQGSENIQFKPVLFWDIFAPQETLETGQLVYMSHGFDWNANYRLLITEGSDKATLIPEAYVKNNSNLTFSNLSLRLVEGNLNRVQHHDYPRTLAKNMHVMATMEADMSGASELPDRENLGDYYIYTIPNDIELRAKENMTIRLYNARVIGYRKTYLFENYERGQREEPLVVEIKIDNTEKNNLNIPLPQGKIELYQSLQEGKVEFMGEDRLKQIPKGATAQLIAGRAFDVIGKRRVLNYDRQRKSEEASIEIKITNTKDEDVDAKIIEKISGDWVIRDESTMYIKQDASTIYFPVKVPANDFKLVTYTYRKEWK